MAWRVILVGVVLVLSAPGGAQTRSNALETCVTDSTSGRDRKDLAKWLFLAMAAHPEIKKYAGPDAAAGAEESARTMAPW